MGKILNCLKVISPLILSHKKARKQYAYELVWWRRADSNRRPLDCQSSALAN